MGHLEARRAATDIYRLTRNLDARLRQVSTFNNPDLTPDGLRKARESASNRVLAQGKARAAILRKTAQDGHDFAQSRISEYRPKVNMDSVAELTRSAQAWELIVKPRIDAGENWFKLVEGADWDSLLAITRFAEPTIRAKEPSNEVPTILSNLRGALDDRAAAIHPDESARTILTEAKQAKEALQFVTAMEQSLDGAYSPAGLQSALIYGMHNLHPMGLLPQEAPASPEAQDQMVSVVAARTGAAPDEYYTALPAPDYSTE